MTESNSLNMGLDNVEAVVRTEIETLHHFLAEWFCGRCPGSDEYFKQEFRHRFDSQFLLIAPGGMTLHLNELAQDIYSRYASNPDFRIAIREVTVRRQWDGHVLATYQEWQKNALASMPSNNGRIATVMFRSGDRLTWLHVHETWLPTEIMHADPYSF